MFLIYRTSAYYLNRNINQDADDSPASKYLGSGGHLFKFVLIAIDVLADVVGLSFTTLSVDPKNLQEVVDEILEGEAADQVDSHEVVSGLCEGVPQQGADLPVQHRLVLLDYFQLSEHFLDQVKLCRSRSAPFALVG